MFRISRIIPLALALALIASTITLTTRVEANSPFVGGDGSPSNPFQIADAEGLWAISDGWNQHYVLIADIDLIDWEAPSGYHRLLNLSGDTALFDGQNYTIRNYKIGIIEDDDYHNQNALFYSIGLGATLKNLRIENAEIAGDQAAVLVSSNWAVNVGLNFPKIAGRKFPT